MCVSARIFWKDGRIVDVESVRELMSAFRIPACDIPQNPPKSVREITPDECLCWVDFEALAVMKKMVLEPPCYEENTDHFDAWALRET